MSNNDIRRQLGGMPTGSYNMADMQFSVRHIEPKRAEEEPSTVPSYDLDYDGVICAKSPIQGLVEAANRFILRNGVPKIEHILRPEFDSSLLRHMMTYPTSGYRVIIVNNGKEPIKVDGVTLYPGETREFQK